MTEQEQKSAGPSALLIADGISMRHRQVRNPVAACGWCTFGSAVGYVLRGPVVAAAVLAAVLVACALVVLRSVLLGDSDPRSPFVRFMLLTCVLTGRPPGDYLPPDPNSSFPGRQMTEEVLADLEQPACLTGKLGDHGSAASWRG